MNEKYNPYVFVTTFHVAHTTYPTYSQEIQNYKLIIDKPIIPYSSLRDLDPSLHNEIMFITWKSSYMSLNVSYNFFQSHPSKNKLNKLYSYTITYNYAY